MPGTTFQLDTLSVGTNRLDRMSRSDTPGGQLLRDNTYRRGMVYTPTNCSWLCMFRLDTEFV